MSRAAKRSSVFDLDRIERASLVRQVVFRRAVQSTNDIALRLATRHDLQLPLLVLTERQTAGRGRGSNRWWSAEGSLTFSLLLEAAPLRLGPERWPQISLAAAVAVCETVDPLGSPVPATIRWPNDVYLSGRKICGILLEPAVVPSKRAEHNPAATTAARLVIGIGLNVNNTFDDAPPEVRDRADSLAALIGRPIELCDVLVRVLDRLDASLARLSAGDARLAAAWYERCLLRSRTVELQVGPRRVRGFCQGVDGDGALLLSIGAQTERFFGGIVASVE